MMPVKHSNEGDKRSVAYTHSGKARTFGGRNGMSLTNRAIVANQNFPQEDGLFGHCGFMILELCGKGRNKEYFRYYSVCAVTNKDCLKIRVQS